MKKKIFAMMGFCALCGGAMAQTVTVADVNARPGETVEFSLNLSDGKAATYTALSFDVQFPETGFTTTGTYKVSNSWTGAMAVVGDVDDTGLATIPFASAETITSSDVENLVSVSFKVDESVSLGTYDVTLKNILFEYGMSDKDNAPDVTFHVNVSNSILLDETSTTVPEAATGVNVCVKRTLNANEWSTICLPFEMDETQLKSAFGEDVKLGDFNGYEVSDEGDAITVLFNEATAIEANHPYIIKVTEAVSSFTVEGVDIDPEEEPMINKGTNRKPKAIVGNYVAGTSIDNGCLFLNASKFWYSIGATKMKAFRAYFNFYDLLPDFEDNYAEAPVFISFDNETTGISGNARIRTVGNEQYYNLAGQQVVTPKKGLYIKNNKKIVVK